MLVEKVVFIRGGGLSFTPIGVHFVFAIFDELPGVLYAVLV